MEKLKYNTIVLDGIDKTGKDLISHYVFVLSKKRYLCYSRGIMSMIAYNHMFHRQYEYDFDFVSRGTMNIRLTAEYDDWKIRCEMTHEPEIDFVEHNAAFDYAQAELEKRNISVYEYNTSEMTPFAIANSIVTIANMLNGIK